MTRQTAEYIKEHLKIEVNVTYDHYSGRTINVALLLKNFDGEYEVISEDQIFLQTD